MSRNRHPDQIEALFHEPFVMCSSQAMAGQRSAVESSDTVLKCINLELAKELSVETALDAEQHKSFLG